MVNTLINISMYVTYALFAIAILVLLYFAITQFIGNIRSSKMTLWAVLGLVVIFAISYFGSSSTDVGEAFLEKTTTSLSTSKMVGSGLLMFYILFIATVLVLVGTEIANFFKK